MRILFLSHRYTDITLGGLSEYLHFLPKSLREQKVECFLYTQAKDKNEEHLVGPEILSNGLAHYAGPLLKPKFWPSARELNPILELCKKERIDLIHAQGLYRAGYMAMYVKKKLGIPFIVTSHSDILESNSDRIKRGSIQKRCKAILKNADFITHLTPIMRAATDAIYSTQGKSRIIHNGIDIASWKNYLNAREQNYILAIGRLETEKGFTVLLEAYTELRKQGCTTSLVIAGTGSIEKELIEQAKALGHNVITDFKDFENVPAESVIFTGYVRGDEKKKLFSHTKLVLFATQPHLTGEGFPIVHLEAMAIGKPVIASDMEIMHYLKQLGIQLELVKATDPLAWSTAIRTLLTDDKKRHAISLANSQIVNQFDWEVIAGEYKKVYSGVISRESFGSHGQAVGRRMRYQ